MNIDAILLSLHLIGAAAWFGAGWYDRIMVWPAVKASGSAGTEHIRNQMRRGGGGVWFAPAGFLTILTGAALYWRLGIDAGTTPGAFVTAGAALGLVAIVLGITVHRPIENRLKQAVQADDEEAVWQHAAALVHHTTYSAWLVTGAFLLMALRHAF